MTKAAPAAVVKTPPVKTPVVKTQPVKTQVVVTKPVKAQPAAAPAVAPKPVASPAPDTAKPVKAKRGRKVDSEPQPVKPYTPFTTSRQLNKVVVATDASSLKTPVKKKHKQVKYETDSEGRPILPKGYRPDDAEEYMNPLQLEYFRQRLLNWRADLVEESKQTIENLKEEVRDVGDEAERATRETENALELRTRDRYRKLIGKIDSTLRRLDEGEYGFCVDTGDEIGLERLEARLTAERTFDAQERWELKQKQNGD